MTFTLANILIFLVSFTNVFLGVLLLTHGERRWKDSFLALFIFCISLWGISIAMMTVIPGIIWPRLAFWFISISFVFFNFFLQNYFKEKGLVISKVIYGLSALGIFFWAVSLGDSIMSDIGALEDSVYFVGVSLGFGKWYNSLLLYYLTNFLYDVYLMFSAYRKVDTKAKSQIRLFFIGISFFAALGLITNLVLPRLGIFSFNNLGPVFSLVMTGFMVYAVLRWQLFNIKVIATEIAVFLLWISFLFFTFSSISDQFWSRIIVPIAAIPLGIYIISSTINDVKRETQEKEKEIRHRKEVEKLARELEVANKKQEDLLHIMNHDVKKPLSRDIGILASILDGSYGPLSPQMKELVEEGLKLTRADTQKIIDFLNDANLKTGEVKYDSVPFDLRRVVESAVQGMKKELMDANVQLKIEVESDNTYLVKGDEDKFSSHVLGNLLKNLTTYARGKSAVLSLTDGNGKILLKLKDTGIGITSDDMKNLFTKGGKGAKAVEINKESTGEGLYDAKMTAEAHNGKIWVESEGDGKGSAFFVELPVK